MRAQTPTTIRTLSVWVGPAKEGQQIHGWGQAYRLSEEQANQTRAACRKRHRKKDTTPQQRTLFLAGGVLGWTSLPPTVLSADTILAR